MRCNGQQEMSVVGRFSGDDDVEGTSWNVLVAPLDDKDVITSLAWPVRHRVSALADVTQCHLITWYLWSHHADQQHIVTYTRIMILDIAASCSPTSALIHLLLSSHTTKYDLPLFRVNDLNLTPDLRVCCITVMVRN